MALSKQITKTFPILGEASINAYIKIENFSGNKDSLTVLAVYKKDTAQGDYIASDAYSFDYDITGVNPIEQAYNYLKTLPEFADAVNC